MPYPNPHFPNPHPTPQVLLERAPKDYPASSPPPLRFIRSCSSSLAAATMLTLESTFKVCVWGETLAASCWESFVLYEVIAAHLMQSRVVFWGGIGVPGCSLPPFRSIVHRISHANEGVNHLNAPPAIIT